MAARRVDISAKHSAPTPPLLTDEEWERVVRTLRLSPRQSCIVALILQGKRHKQIAAELSLSASTVQTYLGRIFTRVDAADSKELVLRVFAATRAGRQSGAS